MRLFVLMLDVAGTCAMVSGSPSGTAGGAAVTTLPHQVVTRSTKPPLGWSSWYAFGGCGSVNQTKMEQTFEKLTNRSVVPGFNKSLHDVGYQFANLVRHCSPGSSTDMSLPHIVVETEF
jgi:hypothetical protein